ncbi:MAG: flagellar biosynthesis regulator FlaF [Rhodospirillaceae bacterium]
MAKTKSVLGQNPQSLADAAVAVVVSIDNTDDLSLLDQDARTLLEAADQLVMAETGEELGEALAHNLRVWVAVKAIVGADRNPLPEEIRINLDQLARYVIRTTLAVEEGKVTASGIETMARINVAVAEGLMHSQRNHLVRDRAYQLWEVHGQSENRTLENWLQAERDIEALLATD